MVDELQDIGDAWLRRGWDTEQAQILVCVFKCFTVVQVIVNIQASRKYNIIIIDVDDILSWYDYRVCMRYHGLPLPLNLYHQPPMINWKY